MKGNPTVVKPASQDSNYGLQASSVEEVFSSNKGDRATTR